MAVPAEASPPQPGHKLLLCALSAAAAQHGRSVLQQGCHGRQAGPSGKAPACQQYLRAPACHVLAANSQHQCRTLHPTSPSHQGAQVAQMPWQHTGHALDRQPCRMQLVAAVVVLLQKPHS